MATNITENMLNGLRTHLVDMISYARYKIGDNWYRAEINSKEVRSNGSVHVTFYIQRADGTSSPATQFQICDADGAVLAEQAEEVAFVQYMEKILYRFKFGISVGTAEVK